jgi:hypothetical protein
VITEELNDVLEYADVVNLNGGSKNIENVVTWPKQDIAAKTTIQKQFSVRVKNPVPNTPASASDPGSYDLVMTNVFYDKSVNIFLPNTPLKVIEQTALATSLRVVNYLLQNLLLFVMNTQQVGAYKYE